MASDDSGFDVIEALQQIADQAVEIPDEIGASALSDAEISAQLNELVDRVEDDPTVVNDDRVLNVMRSFIKFMGNLRPSAAARLMDILVSGYGNAVKLTLQEMDDPEGGDLDKMRSVLLRYTFLVHWAVIDAETRAQRVDSQPSSAAIKPKRGRQKKTAADDDDADDSRLASRKRKSGVASAADESSWNWQAEKIRALNVMFQCASDLQLQRIFIASTDLETIITMMTKPAYLIMESAATAKEENVCDSMFRLIAICVIQYNHAFAAQTAVLQSLQYYEHMGVIMAELVAVISVQNDYQQFADGILGEIAVKEFDAQNATVPKTFARFLTRLTELGPKVILRQMVQLIGLLNSEAYTIRIALIEIVGDLLARQLDASDSTAAHNDNAPGSNNEQARQVQIENFFDILEAHFRDINSYCRVKVIQVVARLCQCRAKFPGRRTRLIDLTISRLQDKSSNVRTNAIRALVQFIQTHPYSIDGGELSMAAFQSKIDEITAEMSRLAVPTGMEERAKSLGNDDDSDEDGEAVNGTVQPEEETPTDVNMAQQSVQFVKLQLQLKYYKDATTFVQQIDDAVPVLCQLLASKTKSEIIDAMDFFVIAFKYKVDSAETGVRKMLHLIWTKDSGASSEETRGVRTKLIEAYKALYLDFYEDVSAKDNVNRITRQLISLTFGSNLAELTSLEQLLSTCMANGYVESAVIQRLWAVYGSSRVDIPPAQRRGAIIVLGMMAKSNKHVVMENIDTVLRVGVGELGKKDLALARFSMVALQRIVDIKKGKGAAQEDHVRLPIEHSIFLSIRELVEHNVRSVQWFSMAEQAINAAYLLCDQPDVFCGDILKQKMLSFFQNATLDTSLGDAPPGDAPETLEASSFDLSQVLFFAGHVAVKQIVHMEAIEVELKRRKVDEKANAATKKDSVEDELEQMAGPSEDDLSDAMAALRERQLLYGESSLLATLGPIVVSICKSNKQFSDPTLQMAASLCLAKFMCVSSKFCEDQLPLLLTILDRTKEATIRTNIVIALGDLAVCFSAIFEDHVDFLYRRLRDDDLSVRKNSLLVLTHLILNGMIKVKGQLGEMAKCVVDEDSGISDLAKLFFTELAEKDNAVYNNLPDITSHLSLGELAVDEESFEKIMKFMFEFIKNKQSENLIDKLCHRFRGLENPRHWRDTSMCLSLMQFGTERSFKKLVDGLPYYQDKLRDETVYKHFTDIITKARLLKSGRSDIKTAIDEFETRLKEQKEYYQSNEAAVQKAKDAHKSRARVTTVPVRSTVADGDESEDGSNSSEDDEASDEDNARVIPDINEPIASQSKSKPKATNLKAKRIVAVKKHAKPLRNARGRAVVSSDDEDEEEAPARLPANSDSESEQEPAPKSKPKPTASKTAVRKSTNGAREASLHEVDVKDEQDSDESDESDLDQPAPAQKRNSSAPLEGSDAGRRSTRSRR